jgi:tRNA-2-methylthio-N6-dimethylallyladenosine synthase
VQEVEQLISQGYTEFTLLGQNVNSYRPSHPMDFPDLLHEISRIPGDFTLGFMTSHPKDAKLKLLDEITENTKIRKTLHLPVQSGSDAILAAMNRGYTREGYFEIVSQLRKRLPDCKLTSDIIVGFPGETENDFQDTLDLVAQVHFSSLFTFLYSPRTGTPAAQLPDELTLAQKKERFQRLLTLQKQIETQYKTP